MSVVETAPRRPRPSPAVRRTGYVVSVLVNVLMLLAVTVWPGWQVLPFLSPQTTQVLPLVTASMVAGVVVNLAYLVADPPALRALGDVVVTSVGLAALVAVWRVFPLSFPEQAVDWAAVARVLLVLGMAGSVIAIILALGSLVTGGGRRR
ncbi:hypothetical protein [uncultured Cellulomonas sp.]|uniref:hypothetical protein n=1 Tax=uncultured Cellulomonas sp. TaxID=189682 RepID=UPI00261482A4|nr:hypothetical protein [uncultured Cellulomonas sp.]